MFARGTTGRISIIRTCKNPSTFEREKWEDKTKGTRPGANEESGKEKKNLNSWSEGWSTVLFEGGGGGVGW